MTKTCASGFFDVATRRTRDGRGLGAVAGGVAHRGDLAAHRGEWVEPLEGRYRDLTVARTFRAPIVTELVPLATFYPAESYHQDYYRTHRNAAYCRIYIDPKIRKLKQKTDAAPAKSSKARK